jgi:hypothetical protein
MCRGIVGDRSSCACFLHLLPERPITNPFVSGIEAEPSAFHTRGTARLDTLVLPLFGLQPPCWVRRAVALSRRAHDIAVQCMGVIAPLPGTAIKVV